MHNAGSAVAVGGVNRTASPKEQPTISGHLSMLESRINGLFDQSNRIAVNLLDRLGSQLSAHANTLDSSV